jgi:hypothetical protein
LRSSGRVAARSRHATDLVAFATTGIKQHKPPVEITEAENAAQEAEADELAFTWINDYLRERNHPDLPLLTPEEIAKAKARSRGIC